MKTKLPTSITTIEEAKAFLKALHDNQEAYHPEDDAHDVIWNGCETPSPDDCDQLNKLMADIYALPECDFQVLTFDPCGFLLDLDGHVMDDTPISKEAQDIIKPEWEKMQEFLAPQVRVYETPRGETRICIMDHVTVLVNMSVDQAKVVAERLNSVLAKIESKTNIQS